MYITANEIIDIIENEADRYEVEAVASDSQTTQLENTASSLALRKIQNIILKRILED